jgi:hypothetical protein
VMGKRDRNRRPARCAPYRDPKPLVLIVTEGAVTEPDYLKGFVKSCQNPRVRIEVKEAAGVPRTVVEIAKEKKRAAENLARRHEDENLRYDKIWCVFDIDQHPRISDAKEMARNNGMEVAISNPCIELWLFLHFSEPPGCIDRHEMQSRLKQHIANYDKHVNYSDYANGHDDAAKRARRLDDVAEEVGEPGRNPTTGMWRLTDSIRSDA